MTASPESLASRESVVISESVQPTPDAAEFSVAAAPTDTSSIAIATSLADDEVLAKSEIAAASADDAPIAAAAPESPVDPIAEPAAPIEIEAVAPEREPTSPAAEPMAEPAPFHTEPVAEAAAASDDTPPPSSQSAQTIGHSPIQSTKDMIMDMTTNFGGGLNDMMSGAQDKAKEALEKGSSMMGEAGSFARGNVEAVVESGKILAAGLQDMSTNLVAEGRSSFETMTADLKELAASKTPADFFKTQSEIMRKSMDSMVGFGSKNSEAMLKLASDMMAPLSGRMNMAVEKVKMPLA